MKNSFWIEVLLRSTSLQKIKSWRILCQTKQSNLSIIRQTCKTQTKGSPVKTNSEHKIGRIAEISVSFSNFSVIPETVDIFVEGVDTPIKVAASVKDGKISIDTTGFKEGTYKLYVKSGTVKSNSLSVVLAILPIPMNVTVSASTKKK